MDNNGSVERRRLNDLYSLESDEKLLHLRLSYEELTEMAQIALRTELTSRGLWSNDEISGFSQDHNPSSSDENSFGQLESNSLSVRDCKTPEEAEVICHLLRLANITAVSFPLQLRNLRTVQVRVGRDDVEKALTILSSGVPAEVAEELASQFTSDDFVLPRCRSCDSTDVALESVENTNHWSCGKCGSRWQDDLDDAAVTSKRSVSVSGIPGDNNWHTRSNSSESPAQWTRKINLRSIGLIIFGTLLAIAASWYQPWTTLRLLGLCLLIPSEILLVVARLQLGASFSVRAEARSLVTHGMYSRIQNPIYFFGALTLAGLILLLDRPLYLLVFLIIVPVQVIRIGHERKVLMSKFGDSYLQYRKQTWF
jgi:protein-S-isoprenylcysteine O-methyltransferase Ste14